MRKRFRKFAWLFVVPGLLGFAVASKTVNAATEILPRADFPVCSATRMIYCISEVTFIEVAGEKPGVWVPTGTSATGAVFPTFDKVPYAGRFSYDGFDVARGYDGVYVRVGPANEYTDTMMLAIEPAGPGANGKVARVKDETTGKVGSLAADMGVRVVVRLGALIPAITVGVTNTAEVNKFWDGDTPVLSFTGYPVPVAIQNSSKDCVDETGVAAARPYQMYALVVFENGRDPFGIPGLSGDILISSNGTCKLTSPTWSAETLSFAFTASSPHFAPDGTTVNRGFYRAAIPINDAAMLFGIEDPKVAATALDLVMEDTEGGSVSVEKRVAVTKPVLGDPSKCSSVRGCQSSSSTTANPSSSTTLVPTQTLSCATGGTCKVGDTGPGGGIVFYVAPKTFIQRAATGSMCKLDCKYLEAAPIKNLPFQSFVENAWVWGKQSDGVLSNLTKLVGGGRFDSAISGYTRGDLIASSSVLGDGLLNTINAGTRWKEVLDYRGPNNLEGWFLPNTMEWLELQKQHRTVMNPTDPSSYSYRYFGPLGDVFWTSTRFDNDKAHEGHIFDSGLPVTFVQSLRYYWPVRAFGGATAPDSKTVKSTTTVPKNLVEIKPSYIVISFTNFQYSSPKMTVKVKVAQLAKFKQAQKKLFKKYKTKNAKNKR